MITIRQFMFLFLVSALANWKAFSQTSGCGDLQITSQILNQNPEGFCPGDIIDFEVVVSNPNNFDIHNTYLSISSSHDFALTGPHSFVHGNGTAGGWGSSTSYLTLAAGSSQTFHYSLEVQNVFRHYAHVQRVVSSESCNGYSGYQTYTEVLGKTSLDVTTEILNPSPEGYCPGDIIDFKVRISNPGRDVPDVKLSISSSTDFELAGNNPFDGGIAIGESWSKWTDAFELVYDDYVIVYYSLEVKNPIDSYTHKQRVTSYNTCENPFTGVSTSTTVNGKANLEINTSIVNGSDGFCVGDIINYEVSIHNPSNRAVTNATLSTSSAHDFSLVGGSDFQIVFSGSSGWYAVINSLSIAAGATVTIPYSLEVEANFDYYTHTQRLTSAEICANPFTGISSTTTAKEQKVLVHTVYDTDGQKQIVIAEDLDSDGKTDIIAQDYVNDQVYAYKNQSSTTFTESSFDNRISIYNHDISALVFEDVDGDGKKDLLAGNATDGHTIISRNTSSPGTISFANPINVAPYISHYSALVDWDGDGKKDLVIPSDEPLQTIIYVYRNSSTPGNIQFENAQAIVFQFKLGEIHFHDMNGDHITDFVASDHARKTVIIHPGTFQNNTYGFDAPFYIGSSITSIASIHFGDIDSDGKEDLLVANRIDGSNEELRVYRNHSTLQYLSFGFQGSLEISQTFGIAVGDMNGDGSNDIIFRNYHANNNQITDPYSYIIYENEVPASINLANFRYTAHDAHLEDPANAQGVDLLFNTYYKLVLADFNQDGGLDILTSSPNPEKGLLVYYFLNDCALAGAKTAHNSPKNLEIATELLTYPNPFSENLAIHLNGATSGYDLRIYNGKGILIKEEKELNAHQNLNWNCASLPSGIYIIECITRDGNIYSSRIIKQ